MRYDPQYWSVVFPIGMYAVATHEMSRVLAIGFLDSIPPLFLYAALAAWVTVTAGLGVDLRRRMRRQSAGAGDGRYPSPPQ